MRTQTLIKISNRCDVFAIGSHLICCGIPAFASLMSLVSAGVFSGSFMLDHLEEWAESLHFAAFVFSSVMTLTALVSFFIARTRDCVKEGACAHEPCGPKKKASWRLLGVSLTLYAINLAFFMMG